jgi:uncharacterized damage-inducible protein DinB
MTIEQLTNEFEHETATTRKHLERLPAEAFGWRPHAKSYTASELAGHLVECVGFAESIFGSEEIDFDLKTYTPYCPSSIADLLDTFDRKVKAGVAVMKAATGASLGQPWRLKVMGRVRFERSKEAALRDMTLSHLIHHRGQFSLYLRLLDVPVPGSYGPSADERPGG